MLVGEVGCFVSFAKQLCRLCKLVSILMWYLLIVALWEITLVVGFAADGIDVIVLGLDVGSYDG